MQPLIVFILFIKIQVQSSVHLHSLSDYVKRGTESLFIHITFIVIFCRKLGPRKRVKLVIDKYRQLKITGGDVNGMPCANEVSMKCVKNIQHLYRKYKFLIIVFWVIKAACLVFCFTLTNNCL